MNRFAITELRGAEDAGADWPSAAPRRPLRAVIVLLTVAALAAVSLNLVSARSAVRAYLLALVALGVAALVAGTLARFGRIKRVRGKRRCGATELQPPAFLRRVERQVELATTHAVHFEQLRPRLRQIAEHRLAGRGLRLDSVEARGLLGDESWLLLARTQHADKFAPGPAPDDVRRLLEALERV